MQLRMSCKKGGKGLLFRHLSGIPVRNALPSRNGRENRLGDAGLWPKAMLLTGLAVVAAALSGALEVMAEEEEEKRFAFLDLSAIPLERITVVGSRDGGLNLFEVTDTGSGIPKHVLEHIFEPLYTTKAKGTGLGLGITADILTRHGGSIDVETELGVGTTFRVGIPVFVDETEPEG